MLTLEWWFVEALALPTQWDIHASDRNEMTTPLVRTHHLGYWTKPDGMDERISNLARIAISV
jgi:hypothetical protein